LVTKAPKIGQHAVLFKAFKDLNKHRIKVARRDRIEQYADLIVTGNLLHAEQGLGVIVPFGMLQPALVLQKRRRLSEKDTKGTQGGILDGVSSVRTLFTMVRQLSSPSVQDALEDIEAEGSGHDDLLDCMESIFLTLSMSIGNLKPLTSQN
jgi:hypothetical protein